MKAESIFELRYNPFWIARNIKHFLSGFQQSTERSASINVIFLAIPLILNDHLSKTLASKNVRSSIASIITTPEFNNAISRVVLSGNAIRAKIQSAIILCGQEIELQPDGGLKIVATVSYQKSATHFKQQDKASFLFGLMLGKLSDGEIFLRMGSNNAIFY